MDVMTTIKGTSKVALGVSYIAIVGALDKQQIFTTINNGEYIKYIAYVAGAFYAIGGGVQLINGVE